MKRKRHLFTEYEMELLRQNPYTYKVRQRQLSFTAEFKHIFWNRYQCGEDITVIFESLGYDPMVVGYSRMYSVASNLRAAVDAGREFTNGHSGRSRAGRPVSQEASDKDSPTVSAMQHEMIYLRQQVEFLKKITELGSSTKRSK